MQKRPNQIIKELSNYMLTSKNIYNIEVINYNNNQQISKKMPSKKIFTTLPPVLDMFFPKHKDQLFWCFYIVLNDMTNYEMINNFFTTEKETKYKWIEEFRQKKEIFKPIKVSKSYVETELAHSKMISMKSIKALCHLKDINIFFIDNQKFYEVIINENNPIYVIEKIDNKFGLKHKVTKEKIEYYRNHFWKLENLDKPLKAISGYKADELRDICKKLNIEINKLTKPQMYELIVKKLHT